MKRSHLFLLILLLLISLFYFMKSRPWHRETRMAEAPPAPGIENRGPARGARDDRTDAEKNKAPSKSPVLKKRNKRKKRSFTAKRETAVHLSDRTRLRQKDLTDLSLEAKANPSGQMAKKENLEPKIGPLDNISLTYSFASAPLFPAKARENDAASLPDDETVVLNIRLFDGEKEVKQLVVRRYWKNYRGEDGIASKTLFMTEWPGDAGGIGFLIWEYSDPEKSRGLWFYHPSLLAQVQEMTAGQQDEPFLESELAFRDLIRRRPEEEEVRILGDLSCDGLDEKCYVVESVPKDKGENSGKKILWVTETNFVTVRVEDYDGKGNLLKTEFINWENLSGHKIWKNAEVINARNQHRTIFQISKIELNTGLADRIFSKQALKAGIGP